MPLDDVKPAILAIYAKQTEYDLLYSYYEGSHELKFSTAKLRKVFEKVGVFFAQNWCAVIIDSILDRLSLTGFTVNGNKLATQTLELFFQTQLLGLVADDIHESATVTGEAFFIMGRTEDGQIEAYFNDPSMCEVFYDPDSPRQKAFAAKLWMDDEQLHLTLYYPDTIERYVAKRPGKQELLPEPSAYQPDPDSPSSANLFGMIPVFHFRNSVQGRRKLELGIAERSIQDAVNILFSNMMISSEFHSLKQRVIISQADPGDLANRPGENWWIPASDGGGQATSVQELGEANLGNFLDSMSRLAESLGIITRTPRHYFFNQGGDPSGEALITMESPLVKKVKRLQANYEVTWRQIAAFGLVLLNQEVDIEDIKCQWDPVESTQPLTQAQIIKTQKEATIPLITAVRRAGWTQAEIDAMVADLQKEKKETTALAAAAMDELRQQDAQNNEPPSNLAGQNNANE